MCAGKKLSVVCTCVPILFGLNTSLVYHTPFSSVFLPIFRFFRRKIQTKFGKLRKFFQKNAYPQEAIDKCISKFLNRTFEHKTEVATVPKEELKIVLIREHAGNYKN